MIRLAGVTRSFPGPRPRKVLDRVALDVARGELVAILGLQGPLSRFDDVARREAVMPLVEAAGALSRRLGWEESRSRER